MDKDDEIYRKMYLAMIARGCCPCGRGNVGDALADIGLSMEQVEADAELSNIYDEVTGAIWCSD